MELSRRAFVGSAVAASLWGGLRARSQTVESAGGDGLQLFWGDLHNHNAVGYAKGSLERSIDLARGHLDFFAFTGHASWHDMPQMPGDAHLKWVRGFATHREHWPQTRKLIEAANTEDFTAFLGYEWHSSQFGDYCMIFPGDERELYLPEHVDKLLDFAQAKNALAITHHVAYKPGWRGANFGHLRTSVSPVVEVFSEHGCSMTDRAPYPYIRHSIGGRQTGSTIFRQLENGLRFGFTASSDDHLGYPGAYGEGVLGVWARDLSRASLLEAIRARRTYAATGDRILLDVALNGRPMGSELRATADRQFDVRVEGQDSIAMVELLRNGKVVERYFPEDHVGERVPLPGRAKCRIQFGWGPWADLEMSRICDWDMTVSLRGGTFHRVLPCFQCSPFDEERRDRLEVVSASELRLRSNTSRKQAYEEDPTKSLVCELEGGPDAVLEVHLRAPAAMTVRARLAELVDDNVISFTGPFTSESFIIQRLVGPSEYRASIRWHDRHQSREGGDWYCVRVSQHNGQFAWSSPIWVG